ncbi:hypothetical protein JZ751_009354, partial [Albula glossodonta]
TSQRITVIELITRCVKHIFRTFLQAVELSTLSTAISHFLNCFLSSALPTTPRPPPALPPSHRKSRRRRARGPGGAGEGPAWASLTPRGLWRAIISEAQSYFHYSLQGENADSTVELYQLQKVTLLREICIKTGVQVQLREYSFDSRHKPLFTENDILSISPLVKQLRPQASDGVRTLQAARTQLQQ